MTGSYRLALVAVATLVAGPAARAAPEAPQAAAFQAVLDCRGIAEAAKRLACYDAAAGRMDSAQKSGDIVVIDRAQASAAHRQAFGLNLPSLDILTRGMNHEELDRMDGEVRSASQDSSGRWTLVLTDGAIWRQISDETLNHEPRPGSKVTIRRASLGSYMMKVEGQPGIRVHRSE
jgi:hypothetical protein